jgi:D-ribose pyranase
MEVKRRLLNPRLASLCATLRHGEMIYVADAGSGTGAKSLVPLADDVEYIDLGVVTGVPSLADLLPVLCDVGDFEAAIVTEDMPRANPDGHQLVESLFGAANVHTMTYLPDFYLLRDRVKAVVQTGDYAVHANVVLVAGYPSPAIPLTWLTSSEWFNQPGQPSPGHGED